MESKNSRSTSHNSPDFTSEELQQHIQHLETLIAEKTKVIGHLQEDIASFSVRAAQAEQALTNNTDVQAMQNLKVKYQALKQRTKTIIEQYKKRLEDLQKHAMHDEHEIMAFQMGLNKTHKKIQELKAQHTCLTQTIRKTLEEEQRTIFQLLENELRTTIQRDQAGQKQIEDLRQALITAKGKLKVLRPALLQLRREHDNRIEAITELEQKAYKEDQSLVALQETEHLLEETRQHNAHLAHQLQDLQKETPGWRKWIIGGTGSTITTLTGITLGALGCIGIFWNPAGWAFFTLTALISCYSFYQARQNFTRTQTIQNQKTLSTTANLLEPHHSHDHLSLDLDRQNLAEGKLAAREQAPTTPSPSALHSSSALFQTYPEKNHEQKSSDCSFESNLEDELNSASTARGWLAGSS